MKRSGSKRIRASGLLDDFDLLRDLNLQSFDSYRRSSIKAVEGRSGLKADVLAKEWVLGGEAWCLGRCGCDRLAHELRSEFDEVISGTVDIQRIEHAVRSFLIARNRIAAVECVARMVIRVQPAQNVMPDGRRRFNRATRCSCAGSPSGERLPSGECSCDNGD